MRYKLKRLAEQNIEHAWQKADKYRLLNQPEEADSICRDILDVAPTHQGALRTLGLALTDRYPHHWIALHREALEVFGKLESEYERVYYTAIAWERCGKAQLEQGNGRSAYSAFLHALKLYDQAETLVHGGEPDPVLRWNRCVRELTTHPLLLAAAQDPKNPDLDMGDGPPGR
jgi:tetratricopeptide (TPR) repeat protein